MQHKGINIVSVIAKGLLKIKMLSKISKRAMQRGFSIYFFQTKACCCVTVRNDETFSRVHSHECSDSYI